MTRSEASRINGAQSQGPITTEGKARSSQNAIKHGLTAQDMCIAVENPEEFLAFQQEYFDHFQPDSPVERDLVKEMVSAKWRQERIWSFEAGIIDFRMEHMKPDIDQQWILPPRTRAAIAVMAEAAPAGSHAIQNFSRYDVTLSRMYHRALRMLIQLRANPIPMPVSTAPVAALEPDPQPETIETPELQNKPNPDLEPLPRITKITVLQNEPEPCRSTPDSRPADESPDAPPRDLAA